MHFDSSTQAKSWIFSSLSLEACKYRAAAVEMRSSSKRPNTIACRVHKFASGYHRRIHQEPPAIIDACPSSSGLTSRDQEILVQFHSHQIQFLIGPSALLYDLRTSETVLSTAVNFFRRFYLSNSVIDVSPRKVAAACAFFAAKVEEEKVEVRNHGFKEGMNDSSRKFSLSVSLCKIYHCEFFAMNSVATSRSLDK